MKKKLIVAAVAAAVVAPTLAMADATVYGKVRVATQYHDRNVQDGDAWGLEDQVSRLGIKGSEDLGNGLKAIYKMEFGVNVGDGAGKTGFWSQRNSYIGLAGGWGTFLAGRHDTPHKMSSGKLDLFADTNVDYDNTPNTGTSTPNSVGLFHSVRSNGVLAYISPNLAGFTLSAAALQTNAAGGYPDADDFAFGYSVAGQYSNGPWFASLSYEKIDGEAEGVCVTCDDDKKWRIGLGILGWAGFSLTGIYEDRDNRGFVKGDDTKAWQIQGAYDFGNNRVKAMYGDFDDDGSVQTTGDNTSWAIGYQYNFSSRTDVQVLYRQFDGKDGNDLDDDVFALQLDHSF